MTKTFNEAFNIAMTHEVGPFWNPNDPDVVAGDISTPVNRRKVGFVNIAGDTGGVTKYGIAQNSHPGVNVASLNLSQAMQIYNSEYWLAGNCEALPPGVVIFYFDTCVNMGVGRGVRILQAALGNVVVDGSFGPKTAAAVKLANPAQLITNMSKLREQRYRDIVERNPTQSKFINGWLRRNEEVTKAALNLIK